MKISMHTTPISPSPDQDYAVISAYIDRLLQCDEGGIAAVYIPEHHFDDYCPWSNPFMLGSYLAPQLKQMYVGLGVAVVGLHHPVRLAEQGAILDNLCKGKFIMGFGTGGIPLESLGFGVDPSTQSWDLEGQMQLVERLWAKQVDDEPIVIDTRYYQGTLTQRIMPTPYRSPRPIMKMGVGFPDRVKLAAQNGWAAFVPPPHYGLYQETLRAAGHDEATVAECLAWTSVGVGTVHIAETDAQARSEMLAIMQSRADWLKVQFAAEQRMGVKNMFIMPPPNYTSEEFLLQRSVFGSPATVIKQFERIAAMGVGELVLEHEFGVHTPARVAMCQRSLDLLLNEVLPHFGRERFPAEVPHGVAERTDARAAAD
jgi:alkanesulfonate monooxygenase SsuD/methylene tetrahydromethanopterin reductase-like flavin-dependent oxidoreductase (luciferase family)